MSAVTRDRGGERAVSYSIDAKATYELKDGELYISYVPNWERGRMSNGRFRANANPQRCTYLVMVDGKIHGWGFGPVKVPHKHPITTAKDMADALKVRQGAMRPRPESEAETTEAETETKPKPTRKARTRPGVRVTTA